MKRSWVLAGLAATSCTLVALSDEITQSSCQDDFDCDVLNQVEDPELADPCFVWLCARSSRRCERLPRDVDRDGARPPACIEPGEPSDCEDTDPDRTPGRVEVCDGKDNDCDRGVDEGMLQVVSEPAMSFPEPVRELGYAWNAPTSELGVVYRRGEAQQLGFAITRPGQATQAGELRLAGAMDPARGIRIGAGTRNDRFLVSLTEADPPHRLWVGAITGAPPRFSLTIDEASLLASGLRCPAGESCDSDAARPASTPIRLATLQSEVLASHARIAPSEGSDCESPAQPALLNLLADNFARIQEQTADAAVLGETRAARAPALVAVDALDIRNATEQFGWLAAYPDEAGDVIVRRIRPDADALLGDLELRIRRADRPYVAVQLGLGSIAGDRASIGIATQEGCGDDARVRFGTLQITWDTAGRTALRVHRELRRVSEHVSRRPELAYNRAQASWGVAYLTPDGLFVRVLDADGGTRGEPYAMRAAAPAVPDVAIVSSAHPSLGAFAVYSYREDAESSPAYALEASYLRSCGPLP